MSRRARAPGVFRLRTGAVLLAFLASLLGLALHPALASARPVCRAPSQAHTHPAPDGPEGHHHAESCSLCALAQIAQLPAPPAPLALASHALGRALPPAAALAAPSRPPRRSAGPRAPPCS